MQTFNFVLPRYIIDNISNERYEICGNLIPNEHNRDELIVDINSLKRGNKPKFGERASCTQDYYSKVIFHTHPRTSYAVPSLEDIMKVIKNNKIKTSVVITNWGIFQIVKMGSTIIPDKKLTEKIRDYINNINKKTVDPSYFEVRGTEKAINLTKNINLREFTAKQEDFFREQIENINIELFGKAKVFFNLKKIILLDD